MRVLCVTQYFWPESFRVNDVCLGLKEKGHDVTILTGIPNYPEGHFFHGYGIFKKTRENYNGIKVYRAPLLPRFRGKGWQLVLNYLSFALSSSILALFLCKERFDVLFVYQLSPVTMAFPAVLLKKVKRLPLILYILDLWPESVEATNAVKCRTIINLLNKISLFTYKSCDYLLVSSRGFVDRLTYRGVERQRLDYWPQWAEELYHMVTLEEDAVELGEMPDGFRIMFAGNIGAAQGFETIIKAAEKLKGFTEIHWVILGDGRMKPWVEKQIAALNLEDCFHLLGRRPVESMPRYFSLSDALLVSLKKDPILTLTLPAKVQSYLACGKPVLAAVDGEGARVIEEAGAGLTCPSDDVDALVDIVIQMYKMPKSERKEMGLRGFNYFNMHFKRANILNQLEEVMKKIIN